MKAICVKTYYDKELHRTVAAGEELELLEERFKQLSTKGNDAKQVLVKAKRDEQAEEKTVTEKNNK